jgi:hypothetical protein
VTSFTSHLPHGSPAGSADAADARGRIVVKLASEGWELEAVHALNYATFVDEIPQHQPHPSRRLVDRFDTENAYVVALRGQELLGMTAVRGTRPFSLDLKLPDLDAYLPQGRRVCELRLLALTPGARSGPLLRRLFAFVWRHCLDAGFDTAVISGTTRQLDLYGHLGFVPFGPRVGTAGAEFQPMMLTREAAEAAAGRLLERTSPVRG